MKRLLLTLAVAVPAVLITWIALYPDDWRNWAGFSKAAYFTNGQNYAFFSGIGPMLLTALGMGTIIGGLWHAHNCHADGCWNVGKHRIRGSPYCNLHYQDALAMKDTNDLLAEILDQLKATGQAGGPP